MGTGAVKQLIKGQMSAMSYIRTYIRSLDVGFSLLFRSCCCWNCNCCSCCCCCLILLLNVAGPKGKGFGFTVFKRSDLISLSRLSKIDATVCLLWLWGLWGVVHRKWTRSPWMLDAGNCCTLQFDCATCNSRDCGVPQMYLY